MTPYLCHWRFAFFINKFDVGRSMPPFWPFGKKKQSLALEEEAPAPIVYRKTDDAGIQTHATEQEQADYKAALSFFGSGDDTVKKAGDQSQHYDGIVASSQPSSSGQDAAEPNIEWVHHTDGYHYQRLEGGTFDPVAHVKNTDGTYSAYQ